MRKPLIAIALAIGLLAGSASMASVTSVASAATPAPTYGPGMWLYPGNGVSKPVPLTGPIPVYPAWAQSKVPAKIRLSGPVKIDGDTYQYGILMVGSGPLPAKYGNGDYPDWWWHLSDGYGAPAVQLAYAELNIKNAVIQTVAGDFEGGSQPGPGGFTANLETLNGGGTTTYCLSYTIPGVYDPFWWHLDSSYNWVPDATPGC